MYHKANTIALFSLKNTKNSLKEIFVILSIFRQLIIHLTSTPKYVYPSSVYHICIQNHQTFKILICYGFQQFSCFYKAISLVLIFVHTYIGVQLIKYYYNQREGSTIRRQNLNAQIESLHLAPTQFLNGFYGKTLFLNNLPLHLNRI